MQLDEQPLIDRQRHSRTSSRRLTPQAAEASIHNTLYNGILDTIGRLVSHSHTPEPEMAASAAAQASLVCRQPEFEVRVGKLVQGGNFQSGVASSRLFDRILAVLARLKTARISPTHDCQFTARPFRADGLAVRVEHTNRLPPADSPDARLAIGISPMRSVALTGVTANETRWLVVTEKHKWRSFVDLATTSAGGCDWRFAFNDECRRTPTQVEVAAPLEEWRMRRSITFGDDFAWRVDFTQRYALPLQPDSLCVFEIELEFVPPPLTAAVWTTTLRDAGQRTAYASRQAELASLLMRTISSTAEHFVVSNSL